MPDGDTTNPIGELHPDLVKHLDEVLEQQSSEVVGEGTEVLEIQALLQDALRTQASDIHIDPLKTGAVVRLRVDGRLISCQLLDSPQTQQLGNQIKNLVAINPITLLTPEEGRTRLRIDEHAVDIRVNCVPCVNGEKFAIRLLSPTRSRWQISELGLDDHDLNRFGQWIDEVHGMLLVAGPTGSGKTTTLYALLQQLQGRERSIITLEDPVEFELAGISQIQVNREQGLDFPAGIRALLRLDPDYLMIGEIRDRLSAETALDAAVSGHALMATLHSFDGVSAISMLRNYGLDAHDLSNNVEMVVSQRLVRKLCPHCKRAQAPQPEDLAWYQSLERAAPQQLDYPVGCRHCDGMGFKGRTGLFEIWQPSAEDRALLLEGVDEGQLRRHLQDRQQRFLLDDALDKITRGITSVGECRSLARLRLGVS